MSPRKRTGPQNKQLVSMKRFKEFSKDEDIKDFEEDVNGRENT